MQYSARKKMLIAHLCTNRLKTKANGGENLVEWEKLLMLKVILVIWPNLSLLNILKLVVQSKREGKLIISFLSYRWFYDNRNATNIYIPIGHRKFPTDEFSINHKTLFCSPLDWWTNPTTLYVIDFKRIYHAC